MKNPQIKRFKGLNNVEDPLRLGLAWLTQADNVLVTGTGSLTRRDGYTKAYTASRVTGAYTTQDYSRCYVVDAGTLYRVYPDMTAAPLRKGLSGAAMYWTEVNGQVYYANGADKGVIHADDTVVDWAWPMPGTPTLAVATGRLDAGQYQAVCTFVLPDGRETGAGASAAIGVPAGGALQITDIPQVAGLRTRVYVAPADATTFLLAFETTRSAEVWNSGPEWLGIELVTHFLNPPPERASMPVLWHGRMYLVERFDDRDMSVVWPSEPLGYHLFDVNDSAIPVPGRVLMLAPQTEGLIIGTERRIYAFDGENLKEIAQYGVVSGYHWAPIQHGDDQGKILFWSQRGVCRALPFENLTEGQISVNSGLTAGASIVHRNGQIHYIAALQQGGTAFNPRS